MERRISKAHLFVALLALLSLVSAQFAGGGVSRGKLNRDLKKVNRKIENVKTQLRKTKAEEKQVARQYLVTQRQLQSAQDKVIENKIDLGRSEEKLKIIERRLARTQRQLERRGNLLAGRLVDIYQGDDVAYVDVLLGSRDMRTLTSRGYYVRQIVASDVALVKEIEAAREQIERDKEAQAAEVERIAALQADLIRNRDETAELASQKETQLQAIENDREKYERMLAALEAESEKIEASIMALQATPRGQQRLARKFSGGLGQPVSGRITSRFGYRVHPITGVRSLHRGVDLACPTGTPVHAAASGEVIMAGWMGAYGYAVVIDHGGGVSTLYGHNSRLLTGVGAQVSKGQVIARSGSTGWSTGPHVHFEKRVNGRPVNPL